MLSRSRCMMLAALVAAGCYGQENRLVGDTSVDDTTYSPTDTRDTVTDTADDTGALPDTVDPDASCYFPPPCPEGPENGVMGRPCIMDEDCSEMRGAICLEQSRDEFDGEWYVTNPGGSCVFFADTDFCDPSDDSGCPEGARCLYVGEFMGWEFYGCMDACTPADSSDEMYDWACGCRRGYRCDPSMYTCISGCNNDRQCCETWVDENENGQRDAEEVTYYDECENFCDGDDPEEYEDCMASWSCINIGTEGALIGDPCEHDHQCPPDGECMRFTDPETGEEIFPGGYCSRVGCQFVGRGCSDAGGWCLNTGTLDRPAGRCFKPCHVGVEIGDPEYDCRTTEGQEQACFPIPHIGWIGGAPPGGEDGFCLPGNYPGGDGEMGQDCSEDGDCASPMGLGSCNDWFTGHFCTVGCNEEMAHEGICGGVGTDGMATGLCGWAMCWPGCTGLGAPPGHNGCDRDDMACAPLTLLESVIYVVEGALKPPGFCIPACTTDEVCREVFGPSYTCETVTGVCR